MVTRYAMVIAGVVDNVALWDGETEWTPEVDQLVALPDDSPVSFGWTFDGKDFAPPAPAADDLYVPEV